MSTQSQGPNESVAVSAVAAAAPTAAASAPLPPSPQVVASGSSTETSPAIGGASASAPVTQGEAVITPAASSTAPVADSSQYNPSSVVAVPPVQTPVAQQFQRQISSSSSGNAGTLSPDSASAGQATKGKKSKSKRKSPPSVTMATAVTAQVGNSNNGAENTGRWTAEEHRLFLQGLDQHGKGWKKIASLIKSRTVVQIRTHAQKYFQKLAKARQNGEVTEGDHHFNMEGRSSGGMTLAANHTVPNSIINPSQPVSATKKRKQLNGTKRKSISSVVHSVTSEAKVSKQKRESKSAPASTVTPRAPSVAPALAPYIVPQPAGASPPSEVSASQLEDSVFRFLTPATVENSAPPASRSAAASGSQMPVGFTSMLDPIKVPGGDHSGQLAGEVSPTGVTDISFPAIPSWYARGADVEDLLDEADALDWLADSGDLDETYSHILPTKAVSSSMPLDAPSVCTASDAGSDAGLLKPSYLSITAPVDNDDIAPNDVHQAKRVKYNPSSEPANVTTSMDCGVDDDQFAVFDSAFDEQAFVSALLDGEVGNSTLPTLSN